jgi:tRNA modification GTPase
VVAIAGPTNAGKSTLLNRLARRDVAIVSPYPGTTRDIIEVHLDLGGFPVTLLDTAGIRDSDDPVEQEGMRRARERATMADLVLWLIDLSAAARGDELVGAPAELFNGSDVWLIENKIDLGYPITYSTGIQRNDFKFILSISAERGTGTEKLLTALSEYAAGFFGTTEAPVVTRVRHRQAFKETTAALDRALAVASGDDELVAEELRLAASALGRLTGRIDVEDILDVIFRDFCIGK